MDIASFGPVYAAEDTFRIGPPLRGLTVRENTAISLVQQGACTLRDVIMTTPATRERSKALTELEDAVMWAIKGITA